MLVVDGAVGFVSGVCLSQKWLGDPAHDIAPWRDTGVAIRGPACAELELAFKKGWARLGTPITVNNEVPPPSGDIDVRVIVTEPSLAGVYRSDLLISALARKTLWLTDAYFVGVAPYVQALRAAALDGVDVRLLVPGASDLKLVARLSHAGYRPLLEAGVRVYEWNGSMIHAKTAVADGRWARVGSSNLNIASWLTNCEIDVSIDNESFASRLAEQYLADLDNATEIVLHPQRRARTGFRPLRRRGGRGSSSRAAAGTLRLVNTVGAAIGDRRVLGSAEARLLPPAAALLIALAGVTAIWPRLLAWPLALLALWTGLSLLLRWRRLKRKHAGVGVNKAPE